MMTEERKRIPTVEWIKWFSCVGGYFLLFAIGRVAVMLSNGSGVLVDMAKFLYEKWGVMHTLIRPLETLFFACPMYVLLAVTYIFYIYILLSTEILPVVFYGREFLSGLRWLRRYWYWKLLLLIPLYILILCANAMLTKFVSDMPYNEEMVRSVATQMPFLVAWLYMCVYTPLLEEIIFRHGLIGILSKKWNIWAVSIFSCILFALCHTYSWTDWILYMPMSLVFTVVYVRSGKQVIYSYLLHILNNTIAVAFLYLR